MIRAIIGIRNVGVFEDCQPPADAEFAKLTLIYGENARGKSTLAAILRSLKENDPVRIAERWRLGSREPPEVELLTEQGRVSFRGGAWSGTPPELEIFDAEFVQSSVFRGDQVEHEHKRNLHRFVIGEKGVALARQVDELDARSRAFQQELTALKREIERQIQSGLAAEDFLRIPRDDAIEDKIQTQERELETVRRAAEIVAKPELAPLSLPELPLEAIRALLAKGLEGVSADAERRTKAHLAACMDAKGEAWTRKGLEYIRDDHCPFCGRALEGTELVEAYRGYFNEAYRQLREEAQRRLAEIRTLLGEAALLALHETMLKNRRAAEFWQSIAAGRYPDLDPEMARAAWARLRDELEKTLTQKVASPAAAFHSDAIDRLVGELRGMVAVYNQDAEAANREIQVRKKSLAGADLTTAENQLRWLHDVRNRHAGPLAEDCENLRRMQAQKTRLEAAKTRAKQDLDDYTRIVFSRYGQQLKTYLGRLGADFGIARVKTGFQAGRPRLEYCLELRGHSVELETKTPGKPAFRSTLSSGDRSTLALAFFLARLSAEADTASKVVVFDDPITSLDANRIFQTHQAIGELLGRAAQVVVLSHDAAFLRQLWDAAPAPERKALRLDRAGAGSQLRGWDPEEPA